MASRRPGDGGPDEGSPEYQWLYGDDAASRSRSGRRTPPPEETRLIQAPPGQAGQPGQRDRGPAGRTPGGAPNRAPNRAPGRAPGQEPRRPSKGGRTSGRRRAFKVVRLVLLLWLVFLVAVPFLAWSRITKVEAFGDDRPAEQPGTTYLLVGSDSRADLSPEERKDLGTGGATSKLTDTMMVLHTGSGPDVLMSIPRDSWVDIPGHGRSKINSAYGKGGPKLVVETVEQNTGLRVDHYVEIGLGGLVTLVDAVGGIEICPKSAMKDKDANLDIKAGCQDANGKTALGYARSRKTYKALGDVDRARAQREVVAAVGSSATSPWTFLNPVRYWSLAMASADSFAISEGSGPLPIARFGLAMAGSGGKDTLNCGVPISDLAVTWDAQRSERFFEFLRTDKAGDIPKQLCTPSGLPK